MKTEMSTFDPVAAVQESAAKWRELDEANRRKLAELDRITPPHVTRLGIERRSAARAARAGEIAELVLAHLNVPWDEIASDRRHVRLVVARRVLWWLLYKHTRMSSNEIAAFTFRPNHSTILTARAATERLIDSGAATPADAGLGGVTYRELTDTLGAKITERMQRPLL